MGTNPRGESRCGGCRWRRGLGGLGGLHRLPRPSAFGRSHEKKGFRPAQIGGAALSAGRCQGLGNRIGPQMIGGCPGRHHPRIGNRGHVPSSAVPALQPNVRQRRSSPLFSGRPAGAPPKAAYSKPYGPYCSTGPAAPKGRPESASRSPRPDAASPSKESNDYPRHHVPRCPARRSRPLLHTTPGTTPGPARGARTVGVRVHTRQLGRRPTASVSSRTRSGDARSGNSSRSCAIRYRTVWGWTNKAAATSSRLP